MNKGNQKQVRYKVLRQIGKGGFGKTTLVQDTKTGKQYIRKQSIHETNNDMHYQYQMLKYLEKKNICDSYFLCPVDMYEKDGKTFILFDYLKGYKDLQEIRRQSLLTEEKKIQIAKNLVFALNLMHENKIVHTDIQPLNIMVHPVTLDTRFIDFGTAIIDTGKKSYSKTRPTDPFSVSPAFKGQQKESFARFKKNDMWGLGNVLYLFLFDKYPFLNTTTQIERANQKLNEKLSEKESNYRSIIFFHPELQSPKRQQKKQQQNTQVPKIKLSFLKDILK